MGTRLPRSFRRFCGLIVLLLQKLSIRSTDGPKKLLRVIKGPVTKYFPVGCVKVGLSLSAPNLVNLNEFIKTLPDDSPIVFVVGVFSHGIIDTSYTDRTISVSHY